MELKNLRTFQAIVDHGSYQKAAEFLGYTQSTISVQVQQLEEEFGVPLFERVGRRMVLTQVGEQALAQTREVLCAADRLAEIGQEGRSLTGTLRVDLPETLLCYQLPPVIKAFREQAPKVRLILRNRNNLRMTENVRDGVCDLGLGYTAEWNRDALIVEPVGMQAEVVLLAAPEFAYPDFTTPHQNKPASLIIDESDSLFRRRLEHDFRERDIVLDETIELWGTEAIKRCVMENLGFTYLPRAAAQEELASGRLVELEAPISGVSYPLLSVRHKNRWVTPAMELFLRLLRERLAEPEIF